MNNLQELYQKIILNHAKNPIGYGKVPHANCVGALRNPECGDEITVYAEVDAQRIQQLGFTGTGCVISMASASMMVAQLKGRTLADAHQLWENFQNLVLQKDCDSDQLGDLA